jgi:pyruvate/2-oxoglutarate dehydrogenase complex dihydrolipoamide acyltransferase (E2) component
MPALSPTMEEGTLAKWLVKEGDKVKSGQILAEIETDKATMEFEAVDEGVVGKLLVAEGTAGVKVNTPIAVLVDEGESVPAAAPVSSSSDVVGSSAAKSDAPASDERPLAWRRWRRPLPRWRRSLAGRIRTCPRARRPRR